MSQDFNDGTAPSLDILVDHWAGYKDLVVKFIIAFDDNGNYMIHGANNETPEEMFKAISPLWTFDPEREMAQCVELKVRVPVVSQQNKILIECT